MEYTAVRRLEKLRIDLVNRFQCIGGDVDEIIDQEIVHVADTIEYRRDENRAFICIIAERPKSLFSKSPSNL